jgi:hypothetical protein
MKKFHFHDNITESRNCPKNTKTPEYQEAVSPIA